jgi:hypothetical protein
MKTMDVELSDKKSVHNYEGNKEAANRNEDIRKMS